VHDLASRDPRIQYFKLEKNEGHLAALYFGAHQATCAWIALLDADDELTPNSIEARLVAAREYQNETGIKPQLVYGDQRDAQFAKVRGYIFPYLCKELSLCQTSTIMLGKECIAYFPRYGSRGNTDDEIVISIGRHFHVLHCGATVAIYKKHDSASRMSNDPKHVFISICELVRGHRADVIREQGRTRMEIASSESIHPLPGRNGDNSD